jgi:hypothetical protein
MMMELQKVSLILSEEQRLHICTKVQEYQTKLFADEVEDSRKLRIAGLLLASKDT